MHFSAYKVALGKLLTVMAHLCNQQVIPYKQIVIKLIHKIFFVDSALLQRFTDLHRRFSRGEGSGLPGRLVAFYRRPAGANAFYVKNPV